MPSPEHEAMVADIVARGVVTPPELPPPLERAAQRAQEVAAVEAPPEGFALDEPVVGGVPCLRLRRTDGVARRLILYFHGGGYIWMRPAFFAGAMAALGRACEADVIAPDYRRAPEEPFPAPVEDALSVYRAVLAAGRPAGEVVFAGDSAGGGLVICAMLAAQRDGLPAPGAGLAYSPWTDLTVSGETADTPLDPLCTRAGLLAMANGYLQGADPKDPLASPLYASETDLAALAPILVQVGTREALLDDARRFVARARQAGASIEHVEHQDVIHMWLVMAPAAPESVRAFELSADFVRGLSA